MHDPRQQAFAALLADGRVLVGGGLSGQSLLTKAEIFDPTTGAWTPTGDLVMGRAGPLSATLLKDGRVLVTGGLADDNRSAELFDPTAGRWSATGSLAVGRGDEQTAVLLANGRVLSIGGHRDIGDGGTTAGEEFDPATGKWAPGAALAGQHSDLQAVVTLGDGRLLLVSASGTVGENAIAELYDPATGKWALLGPLSSTKYVQSATVLPDGSVLVVGSSATGFGKSTTQGTPSAELLDPASIR
jgi:N-acetylneuraminic acid mutarotase